MKSCFFFFLVYGWYILGPLYTSNHKLCVSLVCLQVRKAVAKRQEKNYALKAQLSIEW